MKNYIFLNLKRFDILKKYHGVNHTDDILNWGNNLVTNVAAPLKKMAAENDVEFAMYLPESHLIPAIKGLKEGDSFLGIGSQGVFREDVSEGGNFGAFTSNRTASSMKQLGVTHTLIGHFEERKDKMELLQMGETKDIMVVNDILNAEMKQAEKQGLKILYCIGEKAEEKDHWKDVLKEQITRGLKDIDESNVVIGYEPIWAIGPGKVPPTAAEIEEIVTYIKSLKPEIPVIYGGGLKKDNSEDISKISSLDGGLIA